jgi:hypothetical protein
LTHACYAYVEPAAAGSAHADVKQFNIVLLNDSGDTLVTLNNFCVRALPGVHGGEGAQADELALSA